MTKRGGTTLFMLGVAGTGLAVAMFFDALKQEKVEEKVTPVEKIETVEIPKDDKKEVEEEPVEIESETKEEEPIENKPVVDYKQYYLEQKEKEEIEQIKDNRYKGDGTAWDKRMYFIKEAYRRSRKQHLLIQ